MRTLDDETELRDCFLKQHPDAHEWLPGDPDGAHLVSTSRLGLLRWNTSALLFHHHVLTFMA